MREVNFSIPSANKASVGITTALYDRRALDCTSTLPLVNSLNHLAYLTTSSARIREILTVDGGVERLICILKDGRSKEVMDTWKWNLAFQCVVNIGVRGSENVRTRVVEADIVPVIATILDNYMQVIEKLKESAGDLKRESRHDSAKRLFPRADNSANNPTRNDRRRHFPPPPIHVPQDTPQRPSTPSGDVDMDSPGTQGGQAAQTIVLNSPEDISFSHQHRHHRQQPRRSQGGQRVGSPSTSLTHSRQRAETVADTSDNLSPPPHGRPHRSLAFPSPQPDTPITPGRNLTPSGSILGEASGRRTSQSVSGDSEEGHNDFTPAVSDAADNLRTEPIVGIQNDDEEMVDRAAMLDSVETGDGMTTPTVSDNADGDRFNIAHRSVDGSIITPVVATPTGPVGFGTQLPAEPTPQQAQPIWHQRYAPERVTSPGIVASVPRDEDVLLSLQLLAYVSKYCNLRFYFQQSHLVPKLKIGRELQKFDAEASAESPEDVDNEEEYLQFDDYNIFPLVEKFTLRYHSEEMKYWAGVVMRNLCRKDRSQGGIRQCAYYKCGKWEAYSRQFAKCRRCRQTKYCSKECQKQAWVYHRHWCMASSS